MPTRKTSDHYLVWLHDQVAQSQSRSKGRSHWSLLTRLHETIFVAIVSHDENRIADAKDLRYEFLAENEDEQGSLEWMRLPCSMLELLVVLSRLAAFEMEDDPAIWFWHLIDILNLERFDDKSYDEEAEATIDKVLDRVIWRQYGPDGVGGLFPLRDSVRDQRQVELWYQLNAYLLEQF